IAPLRIARVPVELAETVEYEELTLTDCQRELIETIRSFFGRNTPSRFLVHGVTGSGKTEIYLRLIGEAVKRGGSAIFLVPEIGLTPLLGRLVVSRFPGRVSLLHSGMSDGERFDQWERIRDGRASVVVGTRSAVFAPLKNLRLVIIDEEQDGSYKQDESPCYHAREVAWQRIRQTRGILVMGSATPSIETFHQAAICGDAGYFNIPERVNARPMPVISVVDMREEFQRRGKNVIISQQLEQELASCMERREQAIVLLNRRGYARALLCRSCGHIYLCSDCSISMTYHRQEGRLACHYCGREREVPEECAECGGSYIHYAGAGTEQLEALLRALMPGARIARLDRDTTRRRGVLRTTLLDFSKRKLDILVGTQMLAKGHDFPDVTLVGVIAADTGLAFPDFRAAERTFQLMTQVAGRAGRGTAAGRVVIQSYCPENYALRCATKQDYRSFYEHEINFRRLMGYPPFQNLVQILVSDPDFDAARRTAEKTALAVRQGIEHLDAGARPRVLGPAVAPLEKIRGKYRIQLLLKNRPGTDLSPVLHESLKELFRHGRLSARIHIDVDPLSLL
ncbi:MAG TPA: primosomal protein N', partial [Acidobacteriota bacterium]|nr:primosomal protein N' [Acidobacteriota bacterium]